jgi:hypothetical protein
MSTPLSIDIAISEGFRSFIDLHSNPEPSPIVVQTQKPHPIPLVEKNEDLVKEAPCYKHPNGLE